MAATTALLEVLMQVLPVSTSTRSGYYIDDVIITYPPHIEITFATGWNLENAHTSRTNNYGFLTSQNFHPDQDAIAVVGDSYVEASMLPESKRLGSQLQSLLTPRRVYAMGGPGSSLLDYAERVRFAHDQLHVKDFVLIVEPGDIKQSLCGSGNNHGPCLDPATLHPAIVRQAPPTVIKKLVRHSAFAQYLVSQLKIDAGALLAVLTAEARPTERADSVSMSSEPKGYVPEPVASAVENAFFERVRPYHDGRFVLVLDSDRTALPVSGAPVNTTRDHFIDAARANGFIVVDPTPAFTAFRQNTGLILEVSPRDGHWNEAAVSLIAQAVADVFRSEKSAGALGADPASAVVSPMP
jgi:hypothetical protein